MPWVYIGKCLAILGVLCLSLSLSPSRAFFDRGDSWLVQQITWMQPYPHLKDFPEHGSICENSRAEHALRGEVRACVARDLVIERVWRAAALSR